MTAVFADTSYWIALTNVQDADHEKAEAFSASLKLRPVLTPSGPHRIPELFRRLGATLRRAAAAAVQAMMATGAVHIVAHSEQAFQAGLALGDRHFEQEGFRVLFRDA
jgi:predicted nucleic acid-binding protein